MGGRMPIHKPYMSMLRTRKYLEEQPQEKKLPWGYDTLEEIKKEDAWAKKLVGEVGSIALYNSSDNPNARNPEGGKLEWYPAGEDYNPGRKASDILTNMGLENIGYHRPAIEVFDKDVATQPDRLKSALRLDMLHYFTENKFLDKNKNFKDIIGKLEATVTDKESLRKEKKNPGHIRRVEVSGLLRGAYNNLSNDRLGPMAGRARMWREHPGYHVYTKKQRKLINQFKEELDKWSKKPIDKNADKARDRDKYKVYKTP